MENILRLSASECKGEDRLAEPVAAHCRPQTARAPKFQIQIKLSSRGHHDWPVYGKQRPQKEPAFPEHDLSPLGGSVRPGDADGIVISSKAVSGP
jgi:hypothetical protein